MTFQIDVTVQFDEFEACHAVQIDCLKEKYETKEFVFTQSVIKNSNIYIYI